MRPAPGKRRGLAAQGLCLSASLLLALPSPAPADRHPAPESFPIVFHMTLEDAIAHALEHNRALLDRRLDREVERLSLDLTEDRWSPRFTVNPFVSRDRLDRRVGGDAEVSLRIPTGGRFALRREQTRSDAFGDAWSNTLSFTQPLLKGAGRGIDTATVRQARLAEQINILALRQAVADLVVEVITVYRTLIGAVRQVQIGEASLRRAREQLAATRALIRAGRVAQREAVRAEAAVANRELSLARERNRLDAANFALIAILELGSLVRVRPVDALKVERPHAGVEPELEEVLRSRPDFLQATRQVEIARSRRAVARNNLLPDLSLSLERSRDGAGREDTLIRLGAVIPLNDRSPDLEHMTARHELLKAERRLVELRESIGIALRQAVDDVEVGLRLTELARGARELAQEHLEIERMKFGQGLSSSFEVSASEDELLRAEQDEVDTITAYLDALTRLDRISGRTLERWGIGLEAIAQ